MLLRVRSRTPRGQVGDDFLYLTRTILRLWSRLATLTLFETSFYESNFSYVGFMKIQNIFTSTIASSTNVKMLRIESH